MEPAESAQLITGFITRHPGRPLLIALDGPSAAGTTTLARTVAPLLAAAVVNADDFYRDLPEDERWRLDAAQGLAMYFDWQRLRREALEPLKAGRAALFRPYSWLPEGGLAEAWTEIPPAGIIVLEGVYAARPEFSDLIDVSVLVDTPAPERHRRLVARGHGNDQWWPRWDAAETLYFRSIRPPHSFDLVVPGH